MTTTIHPFPTGSKTFSTLMVLLPIIWQMRLDWVNSVSINGITNTYMWSYGSKSNYRMQSTCTPHLWTCNMDLQYCHCASKQCVHCLEQQHISWNLQIQLKKMSQSLISVTKNQTYTTFMYTVLKIHSDKKIGCLLYVSPSYVLGA